MVTQQRKKPQSSGAHPSTSKPSGAHAHPRTSSATPAKPGISKLKSSLRQTKRLLLKPQLDAAVKRDAQRRQKALEQELERALEGEKERQMAQKYHMVKFFERQKVLRALLRAKRALAALSISGSGNAKLKDKDKSRKQLEQELQERRVDLNYILHYPKGKKYLSLLKDADEQGAAQRAQVREWVRGQMGRGAVSGEPEVEGVGAGTGKAGKGGKGLTSGEKEGRGKEGKEEDAFFELGEESDAEEEGDAEEVEDESEDEDE